MNKITQDYIAHLTTKEYKFTQDTADENEDVIKVSFRGDSVSTLEAIFYIKANGTISLRLFDLVTNIPESKYPDILDVVNHLNFAYRFTCFFLNKETNAISVKMDIILNEELDNSQELFEYMMQLINITDTVYPSLMKAMWG